MEPIDLYYEVESLLPVVTRGDIRRAETFLSRQVEFPIRFPDSYVDHVLQFHGGVPRVRCFELPNGEHRAVCRFINFLEESMVEPPLRLTWRGSRDSDIRLDYSLYTMKTCDPWNARLSYCDDIPKRLIPIAAIDTAGHDARVMFEFDLLCFDYDHEPEPSIVTWCFETSWFTPEDTKFVAASFDEFLAMLHECAPDDPIANEEIDPKYF